MICLKKIVFVTNYFGNGGAATVMKTIIENLPKGKYKIKLISFLDDENKYEIPDNVEYIKLSNDMKLNAIQKIKTIVKLRKILKKEKHSTIISFEYFINMRTIIANLFLKNKLIISERNDPSKSGHNKKNLRNTLYKLTDILVCQTYDAKKYFPKIIQNKTIVIPNPIKTDLPSPYKGVRKKKIVTFCRLTKQKNLEMLIDAFKIVHDKHKDFKLEIYGNGPEEENINNKIKEVKLENYISVFDFEKDIHSKIIDATMFVSSSDFEGISNSMIEAMGIGLPTICTDCPCGGANMMIKNRENGLLVPIKDYKKLAQAMIEVIENKSLSEQISSASVLIKERLNPSKIAMEWNKLL